MMHIQEEEMECPICMEVISNRLVNCVTTDCKHCFHTNCLMRSVAKNGFGCPYCRTNMNKKEDYDDKVGEEDEDDETDEDDYDEDEEDDDTYLAELEEEVENTSLRRFRLFWNGVNGEERDIEDMELEAHAPPSQFIANKLREKGVTFEKMVNIMLDMTHEEYSSDEAFDDYDELAEEIVQIVEQYKQNQNAALRRRDVAGPAN